MNFEQLALLVWIGLLFSVTSYNLVLFRKLDKSLIGLNYWNNSILKSTKKTEDIRVITDNRP